MPHEFEWRKQQQARSRNIKIKHSLLLLLCNPNLWSLLFAVNIISIYFRQWNVIRFIFVSVRKCSQQIHFVVIFCLFPIFVIACKVMKMLYERGSYYYVAAKTTICPTTFNFCFHKFWLVESISLSAKFVAFKLNLFRLWLRILYVEFIG